MKTPSSSDKVKTRAQRKQSLGEPQSIDNAIAPQAHHPAETRTPGTAEPTVSQEPLVNYPLANNNQFVNSQLEASGSAGSYEGRRSNAYPDQQSPSAWPSAFREYVGDARHGRRSSVLEGGTAGDDAPPSSASGESQGEKLLERVDNVILSIIFMVLVGLVAAALLISFAVAKTSRGQGADDHSDKGLELSETTTTGIHQVVVVTLKPRTQSIPTEPTEASLEISFPDYTFAPDKSSRNPPEVNEDSSSLPTEKSGESGWTTLLASDAPTSPGGSDGGVSSAYASAGLDTALPASDLASRTKEVAVDETPGSHGSSAVSDFQETDSTPQPSQQPLEKSSV